MTLRVDAGWLASAGVSLPEPQIQEFGFVYHSRYIRLRDGRDYPAWTGVLRPGGTTDCTRFRPRNSRVDRRLAACSAMVLVLVTFSARAAQRLRAA